jgi:hypothetical protein
MTTTQTTQPTIGARFSLIKHDAFDVRRSQVLCTYCAKDVGMNTDLTMTASQRWAHTECHRVLGG